jgi:hypothetical protein
VLALQLQLQQQHLTEQQQHFPVGDQNLAMECLVNPNPKPRRTPSPPTCASVSATEARGGVSRATSPTPTPRVEWGGGPAEEQEIAAHVTHSVRSQGTSPSPPAIATTSVAAAPNRFVASQQVVTAGASTSARTPGDNTLPAPTPAGSVSSDQPTTSTTALLTAAAATTATPLLTAAAPTAQCTATAPSAHNGTAVGACAQHADASCLHAASTVPCHIHPPSACGTPSSTAADYGPNPYQFWAPEAQYTAAPQQPQDATLPAFEPTAAAPQSPTKHTAYWGSYPQAATPATAHYDATPAMVPGNVPVFAGGLPQVAWQSPSAATLSQPPLVPSPPCAPGYLHDTSTMVQSPASCAAWSAQPWLAPQQPTGVQAMMWPGEVPEQASWLQPCHPCGGAVVALNSGVGMANHHTGPVLPGWDLSHSWQLHASTSHISPVSVAAHAPGVATTAQHMQAAQAACLAPVSGRSGEQTHMWKGSTAAVPSSAAACTMTPQRVTPGPGARHSSARHANTTSSFWSPAKNSADMKSQRIGAHPDALAQSIRLTREQVLQAFGSSS